MIGTFAPLLPARNIPVERCTMKRILQIISSAILGTGIFLFFNLLVDAGIVLASALGLAAALGGFLLLNPKKWDAELERLAQIYGITPDVIEKTIKKGVKKIRAMRKHAETIDKEPVKQSIDRICGTAEKIFQNFKQDPKDIKAARQFLNYYLDSTIKIIRQYAELSQKGGGSANAETLKKAEDVLGTIEKAFEKQLSTLYDDDFLDLDAEISVLNKSMKMDGMG